MMKNKTKNNKQVKSYLTDSQYEIIRDKAKEANRSISQFIKLSLLRAI